MNLTICTADSLNFALLTSPRMSSSLSLRSLPDIDEPVNETSPSEVSSPSPSPNDEIDEDDNLEGDGDLDLDLGDEDDNMFDIEISSPDEEDSGYGSVQKVPMSAPAMESSGLSRGMDALGLTNGELDLGRPCISYGPQERTRLI